MKTTAKDGLNFSWADVLAFRLRRHHLSCRANSNSLVPVVQDVCGIQAQSPVIAQMALRARMRPIRGEDIDRSLWRTRTLVRIWCMRGTVHLLPAGDLPIYIGALKRSGTHEVERWLAGHEVSANEVRALSEAIVQALEGGPLTRHALAEQVVSLMGEKARPWVEHSWGGVVKHAALQGRVCFGSDWQGQVTFVRVDQWLPQFTEMPEQEAGSALLCRYLGGYGPAGLEDFRQWSGMTMKEARQIRDRLGDALLEVAIEGRPALVLRDDLSEVQKELLDDRSVFLLPSFDPYMLGHKDKNHLVDSLHYKSVYRQAGWLSPVVLHKGRVVGTWSYKHRGSRLSVTVEAFEALPRGVREKIAEEADDLGRFLEATIDLVEA